MEEVLRLFKEGKSFREIERITGINRKRASRFVQEKGYTVIKRGTTGSKRKIKFDETKFQSIDTEEKAYWLGFLYADASITSGDRFVLEFSQKDREVLERFKLFMDTNVEIKYKEVNLNGKVYGAYRIQIHSKKLCEQLIVLGCTPRKSLTKTFPSLPEEYVLPFIAGYFDGNGTVVQRSNGSWYGLISTGSENFAESLANVMQSSYRKDKRKDRDLHNFEIYVPVNFLPKLAPFSFKVQRINCPTQG